MKKNNGTGIVATVITVTMLLGLCGCTKTSNPTVKPTDHSGKNQETETTVEESSSEADNGKIVKNAYLEFLNGERKLVLASGYQEDDGDGNFDGLLYGEYSYPDLKAAIEIFEDTDSDTQYAYVDVNQDGVEELLLHFVALKDCFLDWVGVIRYDNGQLELSYSYDYGYRSFATIYDNGILNISGSMGAGAQCSTYWKFNEKCDAEHLSDCANYWGSFSTQIAYNLVDEPMEMFDLHEDSMLEITEFVPDSSRNEGVYIAVHEYSSDEKIRQSEEALVEQLVLLGAKLVTIEEMEKISAVETGNEVQWLDWDEKCTIVKAVDDNYFYTDTTDLVYSNVCDKGDYTSTIVISTNKKITDVRLMAIQMINVNQDGMIAVSGTVVDTLTELNPKTYWKVTLEFVGDTPNYGFSYMDENGNQVFKTIGMSGYDGSILLEDAVLIQE